MEANASLQEGARRVFEEARQFVEGHRMRRVVDGEGSAHERAPRGWRCLLQRPSAFAVMLRIAEERRVSCKVAWAEGLQWMTHDNARLDGVASGATDGVRILVRRCVRIGSAMQSRPDSK